MLCHVIKLRRLPVGSQSLQTIKPISSQLCKPTTNIYIIHKPTISDLNSDQFCVIWIPLGSLDVFFSRKTGGFQVNLQVNSFAMLCGTNESRDVSTCFVTTRRFE